MGDIHRREGRLVTQKTDADRLEAIRELLQLALHLADETSEFSLAAVISHAIETVPGQGKAEWTGISSGG